MTARAVPRSARAQTLGETDEAQTPPRWDLGDLYASPEDPRLQADLERAARDARSLQADHAGKLATHDAGTLAEVIAAYERIEETLGRAYSYAQLVHAADRSNPEIGKFFQSVQEQVNDVGTKLLFVTLELNRVDDEALEQALGQSAALAHYRPWLRRVRSFRPHQLSDEAERILHEKSISGRSAWVRLFDETMAGLRFPFRGELLTSARIFDEFTSRERGRREEAARSVSETLGANIQLFARITNTLTKDKQIEDGWRHFARPISARNLANDVEDETVDALLTAVREAYPRISHRYYALKARWMGLETLEHWDRNAPLPEDSDERRSWQDARIVVLDAYRTFSPRLAQIVDGFFEHRWIDAELRPGKDSGAFCHPTVPSVHPYVLMNFTGKNRDVMTLAHELGHGVHQVLAAGRGPLMASTPLTLAETASVFGEQLTFRALLDQAADAASRRVLLAGKIEDMINTVIRQIAFCEFERRVHDARRESELTPDELGEVWLAVQRESLGPVFRFDPGYRVYWSYIPHFIHVPFYVYAYAFGDCLVNSLYAVYEQEGRGFERRYVEMLEAGGTLHHRELLAPFGLDAADPGFWARGLAVIEGFVERLEHELGDGH